MDDRVDDTVLRPRAPESSRPPAATAPDLDDTIIRLVEPARSEPIRELPVELTEPEEPEEPPIEWSMRVRGTTTVVPLDAPVVIGRRPGPPRPTEHPSTRRVVIPADRGEISGRHARIERLGRSLVVTDLGSTNGVVVHWSTGAVLMLRPGESCSVLHDAIIALGDGVEIEFVAPPLPHSSRPSEPS